MMIPAHNLGNHLYVQNRVINDVLKATEINHNDMDLGEAVRKIVNDYKEGAYNPPSITQLDEDDGN